MPADPFPLSGAARVLDRPETPAAYVSWNELLPLAGRADRMHLGNLLGWSVDMARRSLGASREVFRRGLSLTEDGSDQWMEWLGTISAVDFLEHGLPFLRNAVDLGREANDKEFVPRFLSHARDVAEGRPDETGGHTMSRWRGSGPESLILEITNSCNFACTMCSMRTGGFLPERTMPVALFAQSLEGLGHGARRIRINGYGETTIVPDLASYLDIVDRLAGNAQREVITNLSAPTEVYLDLWNRGYVILVSWDGATGSTFEEIRRGASYEGLLGRLEGLGRVARSQPERLGLLLTVQEKNLDEVVDVVRLAVRVGAGLVLLNMVKEDGGSPWMDARIDRLRAVFREARDVAGAAGLHIRIPDRVGRHHLGIGGTTRTSGTFCNLPWREILVHWDSELTVCNMFNPFSYGMLVAPWDTSPAGARFGKLWNGPNARLFRERINTPAPHPYCRGCYFLNAPQ